MKSHKLTDLFEEYKSFCTYTRRLRPQTVIGYEEAFRNFTRLMSGVITTNDITSENMNFFFKKLQTRKRFVGKGEERIGVKPSTIMSYWRRLNSFFTWLKENGYLEANPLPRNRPPEPGYNDKKSLSKSELERILGAIDLHSKNLLILKRDKAMFYLLFYCGLRKAELLSLQVRDIDFSRGKIIVRGVTSKSKRTRELPMHPTLELHLQDFISERNKNGYKTEYLIVSNNDDRKLSVHGLKHWVSRMNTSSGVKFHLHQFRHTFACGLGSQGIGSYKLQKLMGHTDLRMTERYLRSMGVEDLRDEVNGLSIDSLV